ncbi:hypothetical protein ACMA5I_09725 [Paracoccaceae bacterium GXU_MW_L88]
MAIWRATGDLEAAGWTGCALALLVLIGLRSARAPFNPIFLEINLHLIVITPLIIGLYRFGASDSAARLEGVSYHAVLVTIFLTGLILTVASPRGFVGQDDPRSTGSVRAKSALMLAASFIGIIWASLNDGSAFIAVGLPIIALFALRRVLLAR